jgi:uncharacterized membrane protein YeaQ/YmgE (transglycosylase-associated protein family)
MTNWRQGAAQAPSGEEAPPRGERLLALRAVLGYIVVGLVLGPIVRLLLPGRHGIGLWRTWAVVLLGALAGALVAGAVGDQEASVLTAAGVAVGAAAALGLVVAGVRLAARAAGGREAGGDARRGAAP